MKPLTILLFTLFPLFLIAQDIQEELTDQAYLIEINNKTTNETLKTAQYIRDLGGQVPFTSASKYFIARLPENLAQKLINHPNILSISHSKKPFRTNSRTDKVMIDYFNNIMDSGITNEVPINDKQLLQDSSSEWTGEGDGIAANTTGSSNKSLVYTGSNCDDQANSERLSGVVNLSLFYVESDGTVDNNLYTWTDDAINNVSQQILNSCAIWSYTASLYDVSLSFNIEEYAQSPIVEQPYEPVLRSSNDDHLWINEIMNKLGYGEGDTRSRVSQLNYDRRVTNDTDWAFSTFVAYNSADNAKFSNGRSAYAYVGGPYTQLLYKNGGWSTSSFFRVFGHETAHIFHAFDEYSAASISNCSRSFNGIKNSNYQGSTCNGTQSCVMIDNSFSGSGATTRWNLCNESIVHLGWADIAQKPVLIFPADGEEFTDNEVTFEWDENNANQEIDTHLKIRNLDSEEIICQQFNTVDHGATMDLAAGHYTWTVVNGNSSSTQGYAQVEAPNRSFSIVENDLFITQAQVNPIEIINEFTVTSTISYVGTGGSDYKSKMAYYLSANNEFDEADIFLGESESTISAAYPDQQISGQLMIPLNTIPGNYYILLKADHENVVEEINESNNLTAVEVSFPPYLKLSVTEITIPSQEGTATFEITTNISDVKLSDNEDWLTIEDNADNILVVYDSNTSLITRTAIITITADGIESQTVSINQEAADPFLTLASESESLPPEEGLIIIQVNTNLPEFSVSTTANWITHSQTDSEFTINYQANPVITERTAIVEIGGEGVVSQPFHITQAAATPFLAVTPENPTVSAESGGVELTITTNLPIYSYSSDQSWISINADENVLTINYEPNLIIEERVATITFTGEGIDDQTIIITQEAALPFLTISPSSQTVEAQQGSTGFMIDTNLPEFSPVSDADWVTLSQNSSELRVTYTENLQTTDRTSTITLSSPPIDPQEVTLVQKGKIVLGIRGINSEKGITIYPNPTNGRILKIADLEAATIRVIVSDISGKLITKIDNLKVKDGVIQLLLPALKNGAYMLAIFGADMEFIQVKRLIYVK